MTDQIKLDEGSSARNQYLAAITINILTFCYGCELGWLSPSFPILTGSDSPLDEPLTTDQAAVVGAIICVGGFLGTIFYGFVSDRLGKRNTAIIAAVPMATAWLLKLTWKTAIGLILSRFLAGFGGAGPFFVAPIYSVEIGSIQTRGTLGSLMIFSLNLGILTMYIMGAYIAYNFNIIIMLGLSIVYFFLMMKMPETPVYLVKKKKFSEATKSIAWLRSEPLDSPVVQRVLTSLKYDAESTDSNSNKIEGDTLLRNDKFKVEETVEISPWKFLVTSKPTLKAFCVCMALLNVQGLTGLFAIINFANQIFVQAGSTTSPNENAMIVGLLQFVGSVVACLLIDRLGRKVLLNASCAAVALCLFALATYTHISTLGYDLSSFGWIPVVALSTVVFTFAFGLGPIPYILPSEIIMAQGRALATSIMYLWVWFSAFCIALLYQYAVDFFGFSVVYWGFSASTFTGILITTFLLPETKGKTFDEIVAFYKGNVRTPDSV